MAYLAVPERDADNLSAYQDVNQLQDNLDYFKDAITVTSGDVAIGTTTMFTGAKVSILNTSGGSSDFSIIGGSSVSDTTAKLTRIGCAHYTNSEEPFAMVVGSANATTNVLSVGGGTGTGNAATEINFYTAANSTTLSGTKQGTIDSLGNFGLRTVTFGTSASGVLALSNGTVPSTSPSDTLQIFAVDVSAGNSTLGIRTETAVTSAAAGASDRYLNVKINGTTFKLLLHT